MKLKLQESKEQLPLSFLTDFVSRSWDQIGMLKQEIAAIKEEFSGTKKVEELLQALVDAYLVCVGQLELHMQNKDYIEFPEEIKNESLTEELTLTEEDDAEANEAEETTESEETSSAEAAIEVLKDKVDIHGEDDTLVIAEKGQLDNPDAPKIEAEINEEEFDALAQEFHDEKNEESEEPKVEENFEYFCDFDEPTGEAVTDADLYPEDKE